MADTHYLDSLKDGLGAFDDSTTTLYVPRPVVQVGGEKWRILRKNLLDDLSDHAPGAKRTKDLLDNLELDDFRGHGLVAFEDGEHFRTAHLNARPIAMLAPAQSPLAMPLLRDLGEIQTAWVLALDKEEPKLYLFTGSELIDHSARLRTQFGADEPVAYDTIEERREVQDDIFFHSGSRGRSRSAHGRSIHHALGTSHDLEREKTDDAYYQLVIDALQFGLPFQISELYVMGAEKTVGRFCQMIEKDLGEDFELHQISGGGEALDPERMVETLKSHLPTDIEWPEVETVTDHQEILNAIRAGRVGKLFLRRDLPGFAPISEDDSEHMRTVIVEDKGDNEASTLKHLNALALEALAQGAELIFTNSAELGDHSVHAVMRWDKD